MLTCKFVGEKVEAFCEECVCFTACGVCLLPSEAPQDHCVFNSARNGLFHASKRLV